MESVGKGWITPILLKEQESVCLSVLKCLVSFRAGTCRASTTFYPCRLAAGHLISHALLGAGDTSYERAPSTKSVWLWT